MSEVSERTVSLSASDVERIEAKISSGAYSSVSQVVHEALTALDMRDDATEDWLRNEVAPVYDAYHADPSRGIPAEQVFDELRAHHERNTEKPA